MTEQGKELPEQTEIKGKPRALYAYWRGTDNIRVFKIDGIIKNGELYIDKKARSTLFEIVSYDENAIISEIDPLEIMEVLEDEKQIESNKRSWRILPNIKEHYMVDSTNLELIREMGRAGWYGCKAGSGSWPFESFRSVTRGKTLQCPVCHAEIKTFQFIEELNDKQTERNTER